MSFSGIYQILNTITADRYIGSAKNIDVRFREHRKRLRVGRHHSAYLQNAWNKYGESAFAFSVVVDCGQLELLGLEQEHIDRVIRECGRDALYNICLVAGSRLGQKSSPETIARMRAAKRGYSISREAQLRSAASRVGLKRSPESIALTAEKHRGSKRSQETRALLSRQRKGIKVVSPEQRVKLSAALKGRPFTDEHRANANAALRARAARTRAEKAQAA